jgi:hypothetical protein
MRLKPVLLPILSIALVGSAANAATTSPPDCAAMASLIHQARTDFPSLRQKKMPAGKCVFRDTEYKCEWAFPGDAFAVSDEQATRLVQCVSIAPTAQAAKGKRGENAFVVDPDLTVLVGSPELDDGNWKVRVRILSSWKPQ